MFDEHFHRFISSTNSSLIQTPTDLNFLSFDPLLFPPLHTQTLNFQSLTHNDQYNHTKLDQEIHEESSWSNDEVIQLLRIKSSQENWFKDFTNWDHVSRKLAEIGYKRSSEKCKEKFEEETCRSFSSTIIGYNKSSSRYLISEELDEHLCNNSDRITHHHVTIESPHENVSHQEQPQLHIQEKGERNPEAQGRISHFEKDPIQIMAQPTEDDAQVTKSKKRKRKHKKFKMVKELCVDLVSKMMAQQEEIHKKLLEDMASREEEKMKREEAWRKEEMERVEREILIREHEQEMASDRQSTITHFLNKITSSDCKKIQIPFNIMNLQQATNNEMTKIPFSDNIEDDRIAKDDHDEGTGKRWPRDEVLALINIRSNGIDGNNKGSLWERISQGMLELGYKRSAKRCKEKWENINKYFRKTKDGNKKRSLESRTCPYYHELSKLYNNQEMKLSNSTSQEQLLIM